jgi:ankyrin repeat protein
MCYEVTTNNMRPQVSCIKAHLLGLLGAARRGDLPAISLLVAAGASVAERDATNRFTALLYASFHGHIATVKFLLGKGANITEKSNSGWTALCSNIMH